jgi:hypothetical protein
MCVWGSRLSLHLYHKPQLKEDAQNVVPRIVWAMLCAMPAVVCNTTQLERYRTTVVEAVCVVLALASVGLEALSDAQKQRWHAEHARGRPGRGDAQPPVCSTGLWGLSRHPNLFFELCFHWAVFFVVRPVEAPWVVGFPLALTVLVQLLPGGVATQEMERSRTYAYHLAYLQYRDATPVIVPLPWVKRALDECSPRAAAVACLEMPVYFEV